MAARRFARARDGYMRMEHAVAVRTNTTMVQGAGDAGSLRRNSEFGINPLHRMAHGNRLEDMVAPPAPLTPLMAQKLRQGRLWPKAAYASDLTKTRTVRDLRPWENLSPSEQRFATQVEYWVRRNIRACPVHIAENMNFADFFIDRIIPGRGCKKLWFVWSTVSPGARAQLEPYVQQLGPWVIATIKRRIKVHPKIPTVYFVYNNGSLPEALPNKLVHELKDIHRKGTMSMQESVAQLKAMDATEHRMRDVPWFMPYLWSKDKKLQRTRQAHQDLKTLEERKKAQHGATQRPSFTP